MSASPISTERLELQPLDAKNDAEGLYAIRSDRRVWATMGDTEPPAATAEAEHLARLLHDNDAWGWTVRLADADRIIGSVTLFPGDGVWRSLTWSLHPDHWGRGLMSEAVTAAVEHLLDVGGFARVEAWIQHTTRRSLGVARNASMTEWGRMAYYSSVQSRIVHNVVMGRVAGDPEPEFLGLRPVLAVRDLEQTIALLTEGLGLHLDTPVPGAAADETRVAISPMSRTASISLFEAAADDAIVPATVEVDVGDMLDARKARLDALGAKVGEPTNTHWYRSYDVDIGDGHRIRLRGSAHPGLD
jgi:ribosomal-protein-alanine N-acetyltransferase